MTSCNAFAAPVDLSAEQIGAVEKAVKSTLKDPYSAVLSQMSGTTDGSAVFVCGLWNAKNSMGGYGGEFPYFGKFTTFDDGKTFSASFTLVKITESVSEALNLISLCRSYGIEFTQ